MGYPWHDASSISVSWRWSGALEEGMHMNLKALITTLVLGSSTMASADSVKISGSVNVSLGGRAAPAPNYRPAPAPVVVADPCEHPAPYVPAPSQPAYHPTPSQPAYHPTPSQPVYQPAPVWQAPYFHITNTIVTRTGSTYKGTIAASKIKSTPRWNQRQSFNAYGFVAKPTQAWFDLTEATRIDNHREIFHLGTAKGVFNKLQLQALGGGNSKIAKVLVEFGDVRGNSYQQLIDVNQRMGRHNPTFTIDLDGQYRTINRIVVYGSTDRGSAYKIQAM